MPNNNTYDVVIAGAGLGGLLCAVILAKEGMNVCVIERDKQIGGCLQTFSVEKKVFDSCVHYIGGLGSDHTLNRLFHYAGIMDKLQLKDYDTNAFDKIALGNDATEYPLAQGFDNFTEQLLPYFPDEHIALEEYIRLLKKVGDHFPLYRLRIGDANEKAAVSNWEVSETLIKITQNKRLQNVLVGNNMLYAGKPGKTPFHIHALVTESYIHSSHKVLPGSSQISKLLWQELQAHGGTIMRNTTVTRLAEENGNISYAETSNGEYIFGRQFIANIHPQSLLSIIDSKLIRPAYRKRINNLEQTISSFMLNLVLKPQAVPMQHHNLYWNADNNAWTAADYQPKEWPANYTLFYTQDKNSPDFAESISILCYMHYDEVKQWADTNNRAGDEHSRGTDYDTFKEERSELLLQKVYERLPILKGNIIAQKAATPLTYRDYTCTPTGALYGILKNVNKPNETTVATRTKISNLLLTGQNINLHGVLGVSITSVATSAEILGMEYLLGKIND